jgi:hypothetical protein
MHEGRLAITRPTWGEFQILPEVIYIRTRWSAKLTDSFSG